MSTVLEVKNVSKSFEHNQHKELILNDFCMKIHPGSIYCLLGASGCGKSTLISCILGLQKMDVGTIKVFKEQVTYKQLLRSSNSIGYMPQETALPMLMTVKETLIFFANICQMDMRLFKDRYNMLLSMLELTEDGAIIQDLSGGEQRKVSLAVALIHNPKFVILDEPTVGLDIIICYKIWNYLNQSRGNLTVLMTTHYPHEAEKADICGFMRNGKLLADDVPSNIMEILNVQSLDEACFDLCFNQSVLVKSIEADVKIEISGGCLNDEKIADRTSGSLQIIKAVATKKILWVKRSRMITTLALSSPVYIFVLLLLIFGRNFQDLKIGIVNQDDIECKRSFNISISCIFVNLIPENKLERISYNSVEDASEDSRRAKIVGFVHIPKGFSNEFLKIQTYDDVTKTSQISIYLDQSDIYMDKFAKGVLVRTYEDFIQEMMKIYDRKYKVFLNTMAIENYEIAKDVGDELPIARSVIPSMYLLTLAYISILILGSSIICDKLESVWNRMLLCEVNIHHLLIIELSLSFTVAVIHVFETVLIKIIFVNSIRIENYFAFCIMIGCISMIGSMHGLFLATIFQSLRAVVSAAFGLMFLFVFSNGILQPIELMNPYMSAILSKLPIGLPSIVLRDIIFKGYDLSFPIVHKALILSTFWIFGLFLVSYFYLRKNKYIK